MVFAGSIIVAMKRRQRQRQQAWFTDGQVVGHEPRSDGEGVTYHPLIEVKTHVREVVRFTSEFGSSSMRWPVGSKVDVRVLDGKLEHDDARFESNFALLILAVGVLIILFATNDGS